MTRTVSVTTRAGLSSRQQIALIRARLAEAKAGGETVPHSEVLRAFTAPIGNRVTAPKRRITRGGT
jgi:hypothetical protein